jgi:hypothetical protein
MSPPTGSAWRRAEGVLWRRIPGKILLLDMDEAEPIAVTNAGELWDLLEKPITVPAAAAILSPGADAHQQTVIADIERVLRELEERRLVERVD